MYYDYEFFHDMPEEMLEIVGIVTAVFLGVLAIASVFGLVMYILRSLALQTIAKRRGLHHAWLAWIPVGREWIIGSVSDQYQYLTQGKIQNRRKILLGLQLAATVFGTFYSAFSASQVIGELMYELGHGNGYGMFFLPGAGLLSICSTGIGIAAFVFRQMSMYDLYRSCNTKNCVVFLVLGIIFPVTEPFFLISCRYRDDGMPPRKRVYDEPAFADGEKPFDLT